jgi:hypothetical protein
VCLFPFSCARGGRRARSWPARVKLWREGSRGCAKRGEEGARGGGGERAK